MRCNKTNTSNQTVISLGALLSAPPACSQLEDPWRLLPIQALVDIGMKDMKA